MAKITIKLFGVYRSDLKKSDVPAEANRVSDIFTVLNGIQDENFKKAALPAEKPAPIKFRDAIIYINGEKCTRKSAPLNDGDVIWVMSPASGG